MIEINNLTKKYGSKLILNDISLSLEKGKIYGLVGDNGAGKTTFFRCITGLEHFEGNVIAQYGILKNHLGYLPTEPYFFSKMTGREYLQLICNARNLKLENVEEKNIFDLPLDQFAIKYSTGMKKKLALMGVLMQENHFYILDEPFNGVDIYSNIFITNIIKRWRNSEKTVLISSHIFSTLKDTCDEIFVLKNKTIEARYLKEDFEILEKQMFSYEINAKLDIFDK